MTASIDINNVSKHFGGLTVFEGLSLSIPAHEFVVFDDGARLNPTYVRAVGWR